MQLRDHYKTLGVQPNAAHADIRKAYRELAMRYHPDKNPGDVFCEAHFKDLAEAWSVLSDSRKRVAYDEERWLSGMGSKTTYEQAVTPVWLHGICVELNASLAQMDTYRMSHIALQSYILMILSEAHIGVLRREGNTEINSAIVHELIRSTAKLELQYLHAVADGLLLVAGDNNTLRLAVQEYVALRMADERRRLMFPWVVLAVTLGLCIFMYLYGSI